MINRNEVFEKNIIIQKFVIFLHIIRIFCKYCDNKCLLNTTTKETLI